MFILGPTVVMPSDSFDEFNLCDSVHVELAR